MSTELNNRTILIQLIRRMNDADAQQMLAYATGYEAGRISQIPLHTSGQPQKSSNADDPAIEVDHCSVGGR